MIQDETENKGRLLYRHEHKYSLFSDHKIFLIFDIFILFFFPIFIYASYVAEKWVIFFFALLLYITALWYVISSIRDIPRMHIDIYENGIWHPFPTWKMKWKGTYYHFQDLVDVEIRPVPGKLQKRDILAFTTTTVNNFPIMMKPEDAEMLYEKINKAWEEFKRRNPN